MKTKLILVVYLNIGILQNDEKDAYIKKTLTDMKSSELKEEGIRILVVPQIERGTYIESIPVIN